MTNIVQLHAPRNVYRMICPDCNGQNWEVLMTDMPDQDGFSVVMLGCECGFVMQGMLIIGEEDEDA